MTSSHRFEGPPPSPTSFPAPTVTPVSRYFWDSAREHRLVYQRCGSCQSAVFPPRTHCSACWSGALRWCESSGRGVLASKAVVHRPGHPAFASLVPYTLALVDLEEGFRMLSRIAEGANENTPVGIPLRVWWERNDDVTLPLFTGADTGTDD